jgi:hypothetical protein
MTTINDARNDLRIANEQADETLVQLEQAKQVRRESLLRRDRAIAAFEKALATPKETP